jgi:predicted metal-dependent hydrolase
MMSPFGRGLRRFVDSLQRGLFDDGVDADAATEPVLGHAPVWAAPADVLLRHPRATREVVVAGIRVAFFFARARRRSIGFIVDGDGLSVRAPKWVALRDVDAAVREKGAWIVAKLGEQRERTIRVAAARTVWRDGATIAYLGRPLTIVLDAQSELGAGEAALLGDGRAAPWRLLVGLPRDAAEERIRDAVHSWLQREARRVFAERVAHFAARLGVRVTRLSLSSATTRWGSANANGAIRLHWRLILHPPATLDYVVAHELAHLREMNHSERFWNVVRSVVPEYEAARRELRVSERSPGNAA